MDSSLITSHLKTSEKNFCKSKIIPPTLQNYNVNYHFNCVNCNHDCVGKAATLLSPENEQKTGRVGTECKERGVWRGVWRTCTLSIKVKRFFLPCPGLYSFTVIWSGLNATCCWIRSSMTSQTLGMPSCKGFDLSTLLVPYKNS